MPPKIRELMVDLERVGFVDRSGKGSHRNFVHPKVDRPVTVFGNPADDAKQYQIRAVRLAIEEAAFAWSRVAGNKRPRARSAGRSNRRAALQVMRSVGRSQVE